MYALIDNNAVTQVGELSTLFPNTSNPTHDFATEQGALEVVEGEQKDQRFYWVTFSHYEVQADSVVRVYTNTPKALEDVTEVPEGATEPVTTKGLKSQWKAQVRLQANTLMLATDWAVTRKVERDVPIPDDIAEERAAIIAECSRILDAIKAAQDMDAFLLAINDQQWPDTSKKNWPN